MFINIHTIVGSDHTLPTQLGSIHDGYTHTVGIVANNTLPSWPICHFLRTHQQPYFTKPVTDQPDSAKEWFMNAQTLLLSSPTDKRVIIYIIIIIIAYAHFQN